MLSRLFTVQVSDCTVRTRRKSVRVQVRHTVQYHSDTYDTPYFIPSIQLAIYYDVDGYFPENICVVIERLYMQSNLPQLLSLIHSRRKFSTLRASTSEP